MGDTFKIENDSVIISKNNETKIYPFNTVKGACLKVFIQNINKSLQVKYVCKEADKIFKEYGKEPFADRGRDIRSLHLKEGLIIKDNLGNYKFTGKFAGSKKSTFTSNLKNQILKRDGYKCVMCGVSESEGYKLMIDHIKPESKGGLATYDNGMVLCTKCNNLKSNYNVKEFGRKMFDTYLNIANKNNDKKNASFFEDIIKVFDKHSKN